MANHASVNFLTRVVEVMQENRTCIGLHRDVLKGLSIMIQATLDYDEGKLKLAEAQSKASAFFANHKIISMDATGALAVLANELVADTSEASDKFTEAERKELAELLVELNTVVDKLTKALN